MKIILVSILIATFASCSNSPFIKAQRQPQSTLSQGQLFLEKAKINSLGDEQRMGLLLETKDVPFKGCVIYLEGLGDSLLNHYPLFNKLTGAGYRVLMFDYLGQGGSEGSMNSTRLDILNLPFALSRDYEIGEQAKFVWQRYSEGKDPVFGRNCADSPKRIIGWSTGGLAAYKLAHENWADGYVLIAPGIIPNICVGETAKDCMANITLNKVITLRTLTTNTFPLNNNPHLEPIKPTSIAKEVPLFATNLIYTSFSARTWDMDKNTKGLVFLSGPSDTYVNSEETKVALSLHAPLFKVIQYSGALHEIDNEIPDIANDMHAKTIEFLDSVTVKK